MKTQTTLELDSAAWRMLALRFAYSLRQAGHPYCAWRPKNPWKVRGDLNFDGWEKAARILPPTTKSQRKLVAQWALAAFVEESALESFEEWLVS